MENSRFKELLSNIGMGLAVFTFIIPVIPASAIWGYQNMQTICTDELIPFESVSQEDNSVYYEDSYIKTIGTNGNRQVCKNGNGYILSNSTSLMPVNEVTVIGTRKYEPTPKVETETPYNGGSICNDGSWSPSTGRGTCSWHGGVAYYL